ncbi:SIMPL domain-containing protein [Sphingomonas jaspsi]|uniref:SIMPL domain-containing protein n=1 Tax=Sphingomonas jaspsi TaxID=392409 RepID=UPI0004B6080F|nr:SIMPL domain-containing protein [Sphingomonas jaspsi]
MRFPVLFLALPLVACGQSAPDPRGVDRDETLLTVSATGRAETRPDEARFSLGVTTLAGSAAEASQLNNSKMQAVTAALTQFGIKPDDLQTSSLTLNRIDYGKDRGRYQANNTVTVRLKQLDRASDAVLAATQAGANLLSGPSLRVADAEKASLSAYAAAYKAARSRADAYAQAAGLKVDRILAIRDGGQAGGEPQPMDSAIQTFNAPPPIAQVAAPPPPPFNPGVNSSTVAVRVDFALSK